MEIVADSVVFNRVSSSDTYTKVTHDGGKRWNTLEGENRQVDDHALWIDPQVAGHLLIAGGNYESYDGRDNWKFKENLPVKV